MVDYSVVKSITRSFILTKRTYSIFSYRKQPETRRRCAFSAGFCSEGHEFAGFPEEKTWRSSIIRVEKKKASDRTTDFEVG